MNKNLKKRKIWARDKYTCYYCGRTNLTDPTIDHKIPKSKMPKGEKWSEDNLVTACRRCNHLKADLDPNEPTTAIKMRRYQIPYFK